MRKKERAECEPSLIVVRLGGRLPLVRGGVAEVLGEVVLILLHQIRMSGDDQQVLGVGVYYLTERVLVPNS